MGLKPSKSRLLPGKVKGLIWNLAYVSGFLNFLERVRVSPDYIGMLFYYHRVHPGPGWDPVGINILPGVFRRQMMIIKKKFNVMSLADFFTSLRKPPISKIRPVVITFDDGYQDVFQYAWPIMKELDIPSVLFICTDPAMEGIPLVWDLLTIAAQAETRKEIPVRKIFASERVYPFRTVTEKKHFILELNQSLLGMEEARRRNTLIELFGPFLKERNSKAQGLYLSPGQIKECLKNEMEIGSHTASHPYLPEIPLGELDKEIKGSKETLESLLGQEVPFFSYPAGRFNEQVKETVRQSGYRGALATGGRAVSLLNQDPFCLPRISPEGIAAEGKFYAQVSGIRPGWFKL